MEKLDVTFIKDAVLRENIKHVSVDIAALEMVESYAEQRTRDCIRKTITIYIASIIEALLLWKIKKEFGTKKIPLPDEWKYSNPKLIHTADNYEIIWAKRSKEEKSADKLDFNRMIILCRSGKILKETVLNNLDEVRKLRNRIHIGGLRTVTKTYRKEDSKFAAKVLKETIQAIRTTKH